MPGPDTPTIRYVNENDTESIVVTTNRTTTSLTIYVYLQAFDGTTTQIGTAAGDVADTAIAVTLDYDIAPDVDYKLWITATDGASVEMTLWPDSSTDDDAQLWVHVRDNPQYT